MFQGCENPVKILCKSGKAERPDGRISFSGCPVQGPGDFFLVENDLPVWKSTLKSQIPGLERFSHLCRNLHNTTMQRALPISIFIRVENCSFWEKQICHDRR
jgi:hypothetical protein